MCAPAGSQAHFAAWRGITCISPARHLKTKHKFVSEARVLPDIVVPQSACCVVVLFAACHFIPKTKFQLYQKWLKRCRAGTTSWITQCRIQKRPQRRTLFWANTLYICKPYLRTCWSFRAFCFDTQQTWHVKFSRSTHCVQYEISCRATYLSFILPCLRLWSLTL